MATSKTADEVRHHAADLGIPHRSIVENGGAFIWDGVEIAKFGLRYDVIRQRLASAAKEAAVAVTGYGDLTPGELSRMTGLSPSAARRAKRRQWSETFAVSSDDDGSIARLRVALTDRGLRLSSGERFHTAHGDHDKANGIPLATERIGGAGTIAFGVGDGENDRGFLGSVDHPMVVRRPDGTWLDIPRALPLSGVGPAGFVLAAKRILEIIGGVESRLV
jgi:mannosyl-3-phosphoglycerate phosphatase